MKLSIFWPLTAGLAAFLVFGCWKPLPALAEGKGDLGGGNAYEAEFLEFGERWAEAFAESGVSDEELGIARESFAAAVRSVSLVALEDPDAKLDLDGRAQCSRGKAVRGRHGVNSLSRREIQFGGPIWNTWKDEVKSRFVLHEYLRFTKNLRGELVQDCENKISVKLLLLMRRHGWENGDRRTPEEVAAEREVPADIKDRKLRWYLARQKVLMSQCGTGAFLTAAAGVSLDAPGSCWKEIFEVARSYEARKWSLANPGAESVAVERVCRLRADRGFWRAEFQAEIRAPSELEARIRLARICVESEVCRDEIGESTTACDPI